MRASGPHVQGKHRECRTARATGLHSWRGADDLARLAIGVLGERARRGGGRPADRASGAPSPAAARLRPRTRPAWRGAGRGGTGDARLRSGGRVRARLGIGPDPAAAGTGAELAGRVRHGRAVGAQAAGADPAVADPVAGRRGPGHARRHRDPGRHVLLELAVPAGGAGRLGAAGRPGVPPARAGDRGRRPLGLAAAAASRVTAADRRGPGHDGRRSAPADRRIRPLGLPDRLPAWPARGGDRRRPRVAGHRHHRYERHRRRPGGYRRWPDDDRA